MDRLQTFGALTLGVADLDLAVDFYARIARLEVTERRDATAFMRGGSDPSLAAPGAKRTARGPAGIPFELYSTMAELPVPVATNGVVLREMLHTLWMVPDLEAEIDFATTVLGFKTSDRLEDKVAFLRCGDGYHHSFALGAAPPDANEARFAHFCILVDSLDDVMRFRHNAVAHDLQLEHDLLRHPTSGSVGVYVTEPTQGLSVGSCVNHAHLDDTWTPRRLVYGPGMIDVWRDLLPAPRVDTKVPFHQALAAHRPTP